MQRVAKNLGRIGLMRRTRESRKVWVGVKSAAAAALTCLLICQLGFAASISFADQQQGGVARPSGFALMGDASKISQIANGQASIDFLTTREVQPYIEYFERQGWYVGESNNFYLAIDQESMLIYGALVQTEILKLIASHEKLAIPTSGLNDAHRRYLMGLLSHTRDTMDALKHNDGAVTMSPTIHFTLSTGNTTATVAFSPSFPEELPEPVQRADQPQYEHDGYVPPREWDYRFYDVLTNMNARRSHDAYMAVLTKYMEDVDERVQQALGEISLLLETHFNEYLGNMRIRPDDLRNGRQLPSALKFVVQRESGDPHLLNNPSLNSAIRHDLIENGTLQSIKMTFHLSVGRRGDVMHLVPAAGLVITIPVRD